MYFSTQGDASLGREEILVEARCLTWTAALKKHVCPRLFRPITCPRLPSFRFEDTICFFGPWLISDEASLLAFLSVTGATFPRALRGFGCLDLPPCRAFLTIGSKLLTKRASILTEKSLLFGSTSEKRKARPGWFAVTLIFNGVRIPLWGTPAMHHKGSPPPFAWTKYHWNCRFRRW